MSISYNQLEASHLSEILALWNKELSDLFPMRLRLLQQNIVEDQLWLREGSWVAVEQSSGRVVGFAVAKIASAATEGFGIPRDLGWIHALMVDGSYRRSGIGTALLRKAEEALLNAGAKRVMLGNDLHRRLFPGIPAQLEETRQWFEKRTYTFKEISYDLMNDYGDDQVVTLPTVHEATFRLANPSDREALTAFMHRCFPGKWDYQHRNYWERGGTGREFVLLERDDAIIGFCRMNDAESPLLAQNIYWSGLFEGELGGLGPLGIDESFRGHKYGISIVQAAIHYLLQRGVRNVVIDTTPFVDFYGKLGYQTWKSYARYAKDL
ncbi:GNAT family N-acetyltransferase [Paenibacillus qinlingensis]|uniref:GNAT superfamily N-acetyltransferase n=1 Tax=Paenibacillus qinlingensis TaxID=1837343 RepID=A0ABU1NZZ2_9BACL|nr:GNAT family N-acetyltransferase [Paenibacillus qinlingensis]MDR6553068.1 GNAT superfamily N-acetyltransferase [Paenibacillus qinlingensis]